MVSIVTKKIKDNEYLYLVETMREGDKVKQKTIKYLGKKRFILKEEVESIKDSYLDNDWILKDFEDTLSYQDYEKMAHLSKQYLEFFNSLDSISKEKERDRFLSIFIANSNAIEGSTMTADETYNYLFENIVPSGRNKKELFMASNLLEAWEYMESNSSSFPDKKHLKNLHVLVNRQIEDKETLGKFKKIQNYIGASKTTSSYFVEEKLDRLFEWMKKTKSKMNEFEISFQSHVQFEVIHPFVDGNGRVGRLLMNWLLLREGLSPIAIRMSKRGEYLEALENSRRGKLEAISKFCFDEYLNFYDSLE